jgi:hypothetical protein
MAPTSVDRGHLRRVAASRSEDRAVPFGGSREREIAIPRSLDRAKGTVVDADRVPGHGIARSLDPPRGTVRSVEREPANIRWGPERRTIGIPIGVERDTHRTRSRSPWSPRGSVQTAPARPQGPSRGACDPTLTVPRVGEREHEEWEGGPWNGPSGNEQSFDGERRKRRSGSPWAPSGIPIVSRRDRPIAREASRDRPNGSPAAGRGLHHALPTRRARSGRRARALRARVRDVPSLVARTSTS